MPQTGFIREKREIKYLILYVASRLVTSCTFETLQELVMCDDGVTFFEFSECVSSLVDTEHLSRSKSERYTVTQKGIENGRACEDEIPYSVRLTADRLIAEANRRLRREAQVKSSVVPRANGMFNAHLTFNDDNGLPLMHLEMATPKEETAKDLARRFQDNPEQLYNDMIRLLFEQKNEEG